MTVSSLPWFRAGRPCGYPHRGFPATTGAACGRCGPGRKAIRAMACPTRAARRRLPASIGSHTSPEPPAATSAHRSSTRNARGAVHTRRDRVRRRTRQSDSASALIWEIDFSQVAAMQLNADHAPSGPLRSDACSTFAPPRQSKSSCLDNLTRRQMLRVRLRGTAAQCPLRRLRPMLATASARDMPRSSASTGTLSDRR